MVGPLGVGVLKALQITCPHCKAKQTRITAVGPILTCKYCHKRFPGPSPVKPARRRPK
jgi:ribosomal protein L37AE/L43A